MTNAPVSAGSYALSESGPSGLWRVGVVVRRRDANRRIHRVALGQSATCTINNNDAAAQLTLVKIVTNDNGGTAVPTDWTLSAAGPTPISGATGSAAVTNAPVNAGTYTLSETAARPATRRRRGCVPAAEHKRARRSRSPSGESATCTITNDDMPATLTLVKQVVNDDGGTAVATDWTLTAAGPTAGVSGSDG